jgi:hypothetical protein
MTTSKSVRLSEELNDELERVSILEGRTATQTIRRAVKIYVGMFNAGESIPACPTHGGLVGADSYCETCGFGVRTEPGD